MNKSIEGAQLSILLEIDGKVHLVGLSKERLEMLDGLIKMAVEVAIPTNKSQKDLCDFLGYKKEFPL